MDSAPPDPFADLGAVDPAFTGWNLFRGELYTPEGLHYRPGDIQAIAADRALIRELESVALAGRPENAARRAAELRRRAVELEEAAAELRRSIRA